VIVQFGHLEVCPSDFISSENLKGREHLLDLDVDGRTLEWTLERMWTGFM